MVQSLQDKKEELRLLEEQLESNTSALKNKDNRITELESELECLSEALTDMREQLEKLERKNLNEKPPINLTKMVEDKDKKIEQLESEVRKHTQNLQGIVNTELWEKNREIEKLQNRLADRIKLKDEEISKLEKELMGKDMQLKILKDKIEELGIHINLPCSLLSFPYDDANEIPEEVSVLKEQLKISIEKSKYLQKTVEDLTQKIRNTPERESESKLHEIKSENTRLQQELDRSEKCRLELGNLCVLLTTRLEELAHFLDTLLKHKSVLGLLGVKQQSAIKHAIDQSLDLSKTFNISIMSEDKSLAQLSSLSGLLNSTQNSLNLSNFDSLIDEELKRQLSNSLTYNSHLSHKKGEVQNPKDIINEQKEIITVLREQIETLKKEIEIRDIELANHQESSLKNDNDLVNILMDLQSKSPNKKMEIMSPNKIYQKLIENKTFKNADNSESETWSEPDREVSQARMGLDSGVLNSVNVSRRSNKSSGDGLSTGSTGDDRSRHSLNRTPSKRSSGSDSRLVNILQENISSLENKLKEKENEILIIQCKVMDDDNKMKENQLKLYADLEQVRKEKSDIEAQLRESQLTIEILDKKCMELEIKYEEAKKDKNNSLSIIIEKESQLKTLEKVVNDNENIIKNKIKENDDKWKMKLKDMEQEAETRINEIKEATKELKDKYESEWIEKEELNKQYAKMELVYNELESLKQLLKSAEAKEKRLERNELELSKRIQESERVNRETIIALKRELNEYALRISQVVSDRTKLSNEKLRLEQELRRIETREKEKAIEFTEKEKQFINMKNNIQKQLTQIESQKSNLQLKVSELEATNVELHNRILRLQSGDMPATWPKSTPTSPIKISENFSNYHHLGKHSLGNRFALNRQRSDISGYNSEDIMTDDNDLHNRSAPEAFQWFSHTNNIPVDDQRNIANSSPDLGIESDPGRFSSLETNVTNIQRPLLQTLELTASMNNLLSDNHIDGSVQCKL